MNVCRFGAETGSARLMAAPRSGSRGEIHSPAHAGTAGDSCGAGGAASAGIATAGVTSSGHNAMEAISRATGIKYRHVTYDGGNPAVVATVSGETDVTTQLAVEQAEMIRGKRIRPLATVSDRPLEIEGFGTIPAISATLAGFKAPANYFGIFIPKGVPADVVATMEKVWADTINNNAAIKAYAVNRGALFAPSSGDAAQAAAFPAIQANAWLLHSTGKTKVAPDTVGIPKP